LLAQTRVFLYDSSMSDFRPLWPKGPLYYGESFGTDALCLADFAGERAFHHCCDLGCGSGILLLLLAWGRPTATFEGVELRAHAAAQCRANLAANGLNAHCQVTEANASDIPLPAGSFDLVVSNPPYFNTDASPDADRSAMRTECVPLPDWCAAGARLLKNGGDCCVVYPAARLTDMLCALRAAGLEPKELRFVAHRAEAAPSLFLCRARKGGKPGLTMRPTLFQTDESGRETDEYRKICHWEAT